MKFKYQLFLGLLSIITVCVCAQTGVTFDITKSTIDAGGGKSSTINSEYSITSSIGQSSPSNKISGSNFSLKGGFWASTPRQDFIFSDGFEN